jgi:toxin secretion/phage lysis holin
MELNTGSIFKTVVALGGGAASYLFGGWSSLLGILLAFVVIDYITGFWAAGAEGRLASEVGLKGIAKKVFIFVMVSVAHLADQAVGTEIIRDAAIFFYLANELLSIIENSGSIGLPVPPVIVQAVEILKGKGEVSKE